VGRRTTRDANGGGGVTGGEVATAAAAAPSGGGAGAAPRAFGAPRQGPRLGHVFTPRMRGPYTQEQAAAHHADVFAEAVVVHSTLDVPTNANRITVTNATNNNNNTGGDEETLVADGPVPSGSPGLTLTSSLPPGVGSGRHQHQLHVDDNVARAVSVDTVLPGSVPSLTSQSDNNNNRGENEHNGRSIARIPNTNTTTINNNDGINDTTNSNTRLLPQPTIDAPHESSSSPVASSTTTVPTTLTGGPTVSVDHREHVTAATESSGGVAWAIAK
jgi:hypothetical protein